jgi:Cdc6-like AAA superfamily ATPase
MVAIYRQLRAQKNVDTAKFLININSIFNNTLAATYEKIVHKEAAFSQAEMSNYCTFFEPFEMLISTRILSIDMIDSMFAHRFFSAMQSSIFQDKELVPERQHYKNLLALYDRWVKHRTMSGKVTFGGPCLRKKVDHADGRNSH